MKLTSDLDLLVQGQLHFLKELRQRHSLAPVAVSMDVQGDVHVCAFTTAGASDGEVTAEQAISLMQRQLRAAASRNEIRACALFYHGCKESAKASLRLAPVEPDQQADCLVMLLDDCEGNAFAAWLPYLRNWLEEWEFGTIVYQPREREIFACGDASWLEKIVTREEARHWCRRGNQLMRGRESTDAEACFDRALELDSQCGEALVFKAAFLRTSGRYDEVIALCDRAAALDAEGMNSLDPKWRDSIWRNKALSLHGLGRFMNEAAFYERVIASGTADDHLPELWNLKGAALASFGVIGGALECFEEAGRLGHEHTIGHANAWLTFLAENEGKAEAQYLLGRRYHVGESLPEDHEEATHWYRRAAEQGHADAQRLLGLCYNDGDGVPQDMAEARRWIRSADAKDAEKRKAMFDSKSAPSNPNTGSE